MSMRIAPDSIPPRTPAPLTPTAAPPPPPAPAPPAPAPGFIFQPRKPNRYRARPVRVAPPPPVPAALVLSSAYYDDTGEAVYLVFDRPVDVSSFFAGAAIVVRDGTFNGQAYQGQSATLEDPTTARVQLVVTGPYGGGSVELLATAGSGIVAVDDGGTWAGTVATGGVTLPYP